MSPTLNRKMRQVLEALEIDEAVKLLLLTGGGESWDAGMNLKEYFREVDQSPGSCRRSAPRRLCRAMEIDADVCQAHHRDGQRLVFRQRLIAPGRIRPGHCGGDSGLRAF